MSKLGLSIIIPTYNEEASIASLIRDISLVLAKKRIPYEIIVIDDNSQDQTYDLAHKLASRYPLEVYLKEGARGMGYSILEGFVHSSYRYVAIIDADGHYSPANLPKLYQLAKKTGFAIASRKLAKLPPLSRLTHRLKDYLLVEKLLGLSPLDIESGLKIFHREVFEHLDEGLISSWSIDAPLVYTAEELGYRGSSIEINFTPRHRYQSVRSNWHKNISRFVSYLKTKLAPRRIYRIFTNSSGLGSGVSYRKNRFITHSALDPKLSALQTFAPWQIIVISALIVGFSIGVVIDLKSTLIIVTAILSFIYLLDVIFNSVVTLKSLHAPPEIKIDDKELKLLSTTVLPRYSVLCPLYKEASVLPQFVASIQALDWPKDKLEVLLLLEADDTETISVARSMSLPSYFRIVIVPDSNPKTKPKACNYGLHHATGEYIVIYDAEDVPDPKQLKIAYLGFVNSAKSVVCLQAKLNYYNPTFNLLTRLFTTEYSLWFDVILPGLQSINTTIPLGGTSNHFRADKLRELGGWDAFNVTEDCDLGARLFNAGYQTSIIDSTTLEEANSNFRNWIRQRSRWLKGYMQTYFVHTRDPIKLMRQQGWHSLIFQLVVGGKIAFILINPFLWLMTIGYFAAHSVLGALIESIYPAPVFYMAIISLILGNFLALYNYMIGCAKRGHWELVKFVFLIPIYWLCISYAAVVAAVQLVFKPHYWEKTLHGLHLNKKVNSRLADFVTNALNAGGVMLFATFFASIMNFIYNAHLSRHLSLTDFGEISLFGSFLYLASVPISALGRSVTHQSAYLLGKYGYPVKSLWLNLRPMVTKYGVIASVVWVALTPLLMQFFHVNTPIPFLLFAPVWLISALASFDSGFLGGSLLFFVLAGSSALEAISKFAFASLLLDLNLGHYVYAAIPLSMSLTLLLCYFAAKRLRSDPGESPIASIELSLPRQFYFSSVISILGNATYLSLDLVLAKHYLQGDAAGAYSYISLAGKMVYFLGGLFGQFLIPYISRDLGAGKDPRKNFNKLLLLACIVNAFAFIIFGLLGRWTAPILWGNQASLIVSYLPTYAFAMALFSIISIIVTYEQVRGRHLFPLLTFVIGGVQIIGMIISHANIGSLVTVVAATSIISLISTLLLTHYYETVIDLYHALIDLTGLFRPVPVEPTIDQDKLRILIFNWRDTRHKWGGGAETYIQELGKRWVAAGHQVTIFCGSDGDSPHHEVVDGVRVIRHGGFYLVYFWALLYYMLKLKGKYDVIIDSENGLPFFTPLYVKEKVFLLIHHVHQEVFRTSLHPPFSFIAAFLEKDIMPIIYRKTEVITVSPSSKTEILLHKLTKRDPQIIYNGVNLDTYHPGTKANNPTILYLGRLTTAKSIHVILRAAKQIIEAIPTVHIIIAGDGPAKKMLMNLTKVLGLNEVVTFTGKVSESKKINLYQQAWVFVNPSLIEGWGITTIEANACGTPVVASNVAGLRDAVHNPHSGLLVPYGNVEEFSLAITDLLQNKSKRKRMEHDSVTWARKFDWDKSATEALKIIGAKS